MVQICKQDEESVLIEFDTTATAREVLDLLHPFVETDHGPYTLMYLPPGQTSGDPMPQHGYFGLRKP